MSVELMNQLNDQKRKVDFDTYDLSVKEIVGMVEEGIINVAPEYQRKFRWDSLRQSLFIESIFLGIPVPTLFTAANQDGKWELIDGVQRISTLVHFCGSQKSKEIIGLSSSLKLVELLKLSTFNGHTFEHLPQSVQLQFLLRPIKVTTISDKSDFSVRFDLFERLNTGGVVLTSQEIRNCVYIGRFSQLLKELSKDRQFNVVVKVPDEKMMGAFREELVLRFFAYMDRYQEFNHSVKDFLNNYMDVSSRYFDYVNNTNTFVAVFNSLEQVFPHGISRGQTTTPVNLYEAVSVGAALAYKQTGNINTDDILEWIYSEELKILTTGATNSRPKVQSRIEFCRDRFLSN
jgi:hypothetical protein